MKVNRKMVWVVLAAMLLVLAAVGFYYAYLAAFYIITEDARIDVDKIRVSPQITGRIISLDVEEGDTVQAGDIIARQSDETLPPGSNLDLAVIKAPCQGTVIKLNVYPGEVAAPGQVVAVIADLEKVYVTANIEETKVNKVSTGQRVDFFVDAVPNHSFNGKVSRIGEAALSTFSLIPSFNTSGTFTKVTQRIPVQITINNTWGYDLLPGMSVMVKIQRDGIPIILSTYLLLLLFLWPCLSCGSLLRLSLCWT